MNRQEAFHNAIEYVPRDPRQSRLYMTTIFVQALVAWLVRLPIVYFLLTVVDSFVPLDLNVSLLSVLIVFGPIAWSLATFAFPGGGWLWSRYIGARDPSKRETEAILQAFAALGEEDLARWLNIQVLPHPVLFAFARGRTLVLSSALAKNDDYLTAAIAHEVAHLKSSDAILVQALDRFVLWGDPQPVFEGFNFLTVRGMVLRLLSGRLVLQLMKPMWASYFRDREREADEAVVRHGLGHQLAELIETWELPKEVPNPRVAFNLRDYLDSELRIQLLTEEEDDDLAGEPGKTGGSDEEPPMRRIWAHIENPGGGPDGPHGSSGDDESGGGEEPREEPKDPPQSRDAEEKPAEDGAAPPAEPPKKGKRKRRSAKARDDTPPQEVSDPRQRWAGLLEDDDGPLEEPVEMPDAEMEVLDEPLKEADGLEGPPQ